MVLLIEKLWYQTMHETYRDPGQPLNKKSHSKYMLLSCHKASSSAVCVQQSNWHLFHRAVLCNIAQDQENPKFLMFQRKSSIVSNSSANKMLTGSNSCISAGWYFNIIEISCLSVGNEYT